MTSNTGTEHWRPPGHLAVHWAYNTCIESFIISTNFDSVKETNLREKINIFFVLGQNNQCQTSTFTMATERRF